MSEPFRTLPTELSGVMVIEPRVFVDQRGLFVKTFHESLFAGLGLNFVIREEFFSVSRQGVVRGMHFQVPPADHAKLVYCSSGAVLDVILDLRKASPTFGKSISVELSEDNRRLVFIPRGFAHGFLSRTENSVMVYKTDVAHAPACDAGIRWDSFGFEWPVPRPILSERDAAFPSFAEFESPFRQSDP